MPRDGDPRVTVRLDPEALATISAAAESANVSVGALIRECAERYAVSVAKEVAGGGLRLRRARVAAAVAATGGAVRPASSLAKPVDEAAALQAERQRRLNAQIDRSRSAPSSSRRRS